MSTDDRDNAASAAARALAEAQGRDAKAVVDELNNRQGRTVLRIETERTSEWVWPRSRSGFIARNRVGPDNMAVTITLTEAELKRHIERANYQIDLIPETDVPVATPPDVVGGGRDA